MKTTTNNTAANNANKKVFYYFFDKELIEGIGEFRFWCNDYLEEGFYPNEDGELEEDIAKKLAVIEERNCELLHEIQDYEKECLENGMSTEKLLADRTYTRLRRAYNRRDKTEEALIELLEELRRDKN